MTTIKLPDLQGDNIAHDWTVLKPVLKEILKQRKLSIDKFAMKCEDTMVIPAFISADSIRQHFSSRHPATYAIIDLYLRALGLTLK